VIPFDFITEWRATASWAQDAQVEQDLVISRALVEMFYDPNVAGALAFRGGTALYKLHLAPAARYSEDIDLVQVTPGPVGGVLDAVRAALDPWLGTPRRSLKASGATVTYRMESEGVPPIPLRLKIEISAREHFTVFGVEHRPFTVTSRWFEGSAPIPTYALDELLGTKLSGAYSPYPTQSWSWTSSFMSGARSRSGPGSPRGARSPLRTARKECSRSEYLLDTLPGPSLQWRLSVRGVPSPDPSK